MKKKMIFILAVLVITAVVAIAQREPGELGWCQPPVGSGHCSGSGGNCICNL